MADHTICELDRIFPGIKDTMVETVKETLTEEINRKLFKKKSQNKD